MNTTDVKTDLEEISRKIYEMSRFVCSCKYKILNADVDIKSDDKKEISKLCRSVISECITLMSEIES